MKTVSKALLGTIAAGAMVASSATPALADHRDNRGVSAGEIIAGALIIGGIAAIASASSRNNRGYNNGYGDNYGYDRAGYNNGGYNNDGYNNGGYNNGGYDRGSQWRSNPRQAIEQCVAATERYARSRGYRADVTDIRQIKNTRYGFEVKGRIAVQGNNDGWNRGDSNYGQGWGGDYRGYNDRVRGYDSGSFKCRFEQGRITDIDIDGANGF